MNKIFRHYPTVVGLVAAIITAIYSDNPLGRIALPTLLGITLAAYIGSMLVSKYLLLQLRKMSISPTKGDPGSLLLRAVSPFVGLLYVIAFILLLTNPTGSSTVFVSVWAMVTAIGYMIECI